MPKQNLLVLNSIISGKVQGVYFRASTQEKAQELGLTGWVRNLTDGTVELEATGEESSIKLLSDWLKVGPNGACVSNVESRLTIATNDSELYKTFQITPTVDANNRKY